MLSESEMWGFVAVLFGVGLVNWVVNGSLAGLVGATLVLAVFAVFNHKNAQDQ